MMKGYFLDNASTTRPYKEVADVVYDTMLNHYGNPSSQHQLGSDAKEIVGLIKTGGRVTGYQLSDGSRVSKEEGSHVLHDELEQSFCPTC